MHFNRFLTFVSLDKQIFQIRSSKQWNVKLDALHCGIPYWSVIWELHKYQKMFVCIVSMVCIVVELSRLHFLFLFRNTSLLRTGYYTAYTVYCLLYIHLKKYTTCNTLYIHKFNVSHEMEMESQVRCIAMQYCTVIWKFQT